MIENSMGHGFLWLKNWMGRFLKKRFLQKGNACISKDNFLGKTIKKIRGSGNLALVKPFGEQLL